MCNCTSENLEIPGLVRSLSSGARSRDPLGPSRNDGRVLSPLLTGAGGVGLQRANSFSECAAAFLRAAMGRCAIDRAVGGFSGLRGKQRLDRRVRPFELDRELGDFGGDVVDAFA